MKYLLLLLILPFLSSSDCGEKEKKTIPATGNDSVPACVRKMLNEKKEMPADLPQKIDEYLYNGKSVFLFTARCCDFYNTLYDNNCRVICAPSGGITGKGDGKCEDFSNTAKYVRLIWENPDN